MKLFLPRNQFSVKGDGILQTALACYYIVVCKMLIKFFHKSLSYACYILVQRITQRIDYFRYGKIKTCLICIRT